MSRTKRIPTECQIQMIMKYNRDGSPARKKARYVNLMLCIRQLQKRGYQENWDVHNVGKQEVHRLVHDWRSAGLNDRTIANRMVDIRWLASKVGRKHLIPSNKELGLLRKKTSGPKEYEALELDHAGLRKMVIHAQLVTELRREFGLRQIEAFRFEHEYATREPGVIRLAGSWNRDAPPRVIPITTDRQRELLERVGRYQETQPEHSAGCRSMMPANMTAKEYLAEYRRACHAAGVPGKELRAAWAQERFEQLTGFPPPIAGGPKYSELPDSDRKRYDEACRTASLELGLKPERQQQIENYMGSRS